MASNNKKKSGNANMLVAFATLVVIVLGITLIGLFCMKPAPDVVQGEVEITETRVSGKVPGRISKFLVSEGDTVKAGDTLVILDSPEVEAKLLQARAAERAAAALKNKADKGAREEQIQSAFEMWQKAQAGLDVAKKSFDRVQALFEKEVIPAQKRDEAEANYKAMLATEQAAKLQYELAKKGAMDEDKSAANAQLSRAKGAVAEVKSYLNETVLLAPIDGVVSEIFPKKGELVGSGAPIMNIADINDVWVTFSIREKDYMKFSKGSLIKAFVPALNNKELSLKVTYVKDMGSFAAWKATKPVGEFDSKSFEIRAVPDEHSGLVQGMSVIIKE